MLWYSPLNKRSSCSFPNQVRAMGAWQAMNETSAKRRSAFFPCARRVLPYRLPGIEAILIDIAIGKVAAPGGSLSLAEMQIDRNQHLIPCHRGLCRLLVVVRCQAGPHQLDLANKNIIGVPIELAAARAEEIGRASC